MYLLPLLDLFCPHSHKSWYFFLSPISSLIFVMNLFLCFVYPSCFISCFSPGPTLIEVAPFYWFKVGSSSAIVCDPASEAATFFIWFNQPEVNDLCPIDFFDVGAPYVDFHDFWVPRECITHLKAVYNSRGDFMQGFLLGRSVREHFLKLFGSMMNDIEHNFIDTMSVERILQWRAVV